MELREHFPLLTQHPELCYLDSAATSLKPKSVIEAVKRYYAEYGANSARGLYPLAEATTEQCEKTRALVAGFIGSAPQEVIFTSGTTASLNMAARLLETTLQSNESVVATDLEHHSNYLPWKELAQRRGAAFRLAASTTTGALTEESFHDVLDDRTAIVALTALSNVSGTLYDVPRLIRFIRKKAPRATIIVDAAQHAAHLPIAVREWDADFLAFSGHKMYGPTGIGVLYGKRALLESLSPVQFGGGMVLDACATEIVYREIPSRFEAGTPDLAGLFGLEAAITFLHGIGWETLREHDVRLQAYARKALSAAFGEDIRFIGSDDSAKQAGILSFNLGTLHPHDLAQLLGDRGIAIRAGEHCAAPFHRAKALPATARISFGLYNTPADIDRLVAALKAAQSLLSLKANS